MTDMEKKVMVRLCAKILSKTDLYDTDIEVRNLIDWICVSEQIKSNNNEIRSITGEYKRIEPDCQEGVRTCFTSGQYWRISLPNWAAISALPFSKSSCLCAPAHVRPAEGWTTGQREGTSPTCSGS